MRGLARVEDLVRDCEARVCALVAREHLERDLVGVHREDRVDDLDRLIVGERVIEVGLLRFPDRRARLLPLLHEVSEVCGAVLPLVAKVAAENGGGGHHRVAEEARILDATTNADVTAAVVEREDDVRRRGRGDELALARVVNLDGARAFLAHSTDSSRSLLLSLSSVLARRRWARRSDRYAALRTSSDAPLASNASVLR